MENSFEGNNQPNKSSESTKKPFSKRLKEKIPSISE